MLMTLVTTLAPLLIGKLADAFTAYQNKQISIAELNAKVQEALLQAFAEVAKQQSISIEKTFASFMDAAKSSKLIRGVWAAVTLSQLAVLLWHQVGISAFVRTFGGSWPSSGSTVEWAYLLVAACVGMGPVVLNKGPGKVDVSSLKTTVGK
jgi:hypothetical protein